MCRLVATVLCYSTVPHGRPLAGIVGRSYDPTGWAYTADRTPCGRIDKIGHTGRRPNHH
jgi:hypothetical protein